MYQIHGFNCQIYGIPKSKVPDVLSRLEKKYNKSIFEKEGDIVVVFIFRVVNNKYQISFEIEKDTLQQTKYIKTEESPEFPDSQKNIRGSMFKLSADVR